ncbi:MAG TPA: GNAT family N-acetyltransferase [Bryobacteraceae bacterium]|nr:GNAT family N-acetyltransferase [Bryobacteraceae bacterium]
MSIRIVPAVESDVPLILEMIEGLAEYEKLSQEVIATGERLRETLFAARPAAEVLLGYLDGECAGMALYFSNYSTFLARPGLFLEDLYVKPHLRGRGLGRALLAKLAEIAVERDYGRVEWDVLDWNAPSIGFYKALGAIPMDEWTRFRLTGDALRRLGNDR